MIEKNFKKFINEENIIFKSYNKYFFATKNIKDIEFDMEKLKINKKIEKITNIEEIFVTKDKLIEIVSAILSGKHIILYGPPGTGKTTIAQKLADIFTCSFELVTATSDWSTYNTVGGLKITSKDGNENFEPVNGCLIDAILKCCNCIGNEVNKLESKVGHWLIIDELNRADMDKAFGQVFTALDPDNSHIKLDFHQSDLKKDIYIPKRFRIIGTMNNYDKDFLFHVSYALIRRFSYIYIGIPETEDEKKKEISSIKAQIVKEVRRKLNKNFTKEKLEDGYTKIIDYLIDIISMIRPGENKDHGKLSREIGFAQFKDTLKFVVLAYECLFDDQADNDELKLKESFLDMSIAANIIPQLDGLNKTKLNNFSEDLNKYKFLSKTQKAIDEYTNNSY